MDEGVVATTPTSFFKLQLSENASMLFHCWNLSRMLNFEGIFLTEMILSLEIDFRGQPLLSLSFICANVPDN